MNILLPTNNGINATYDFFAQFAVAIWNDAANVERFSVIFHIERVLVLAALKIAVIRICFIYCRLETL